MTEQITPTPTPAPPAVPEPTTPPAPAAPPGAAPLGEAGVKALQAERDARKKAEAELAAIRQQTEDSQKTAEQKAAEAAAERDAAKLDSLRFRVALEKGLPVTLAARLTGTSQEELEADADALMALIPPKAPEAPPAPPAGPTVPGQQPGGSTPALITQADLDALAAAGKYDEINKLRREGRLTHLGVAPPKA